MLYHTTMCPHTTHTHTHTSRYFYNIFLKKSSLIFDYNKLPTTVLETYSECTVKGPECDLFIAQRTSLNFNKFPTIQNGAQTT